ncbi:ABC transporter substrate-binding protein [Saccharothrix longispora]|uniref:ABC transporter substrate-binding protein n=1 Tax=Saccharothrix longispora TaxID=33920 RepID=UPI0028FD19C9|nr:ABC transporter substrate-binding protein [Saccharothrix longispora]MDU0288019.1 ABC transporter substrate-binding protein [Saccharothrix longispora]
MVERLSSVEVIDELVKLLQDLTERPRFGELPGRRSGARAGGDRGIPLVCLVRGPESAGLLGALRAHLRGAHPGRVPHALHRFEDAADAPAGPGGGVGSEARTLEAVGAILVSVARELSSGVNGRYGRHEFRRLELVYWLMNQRVDGADPESAATLLTRLRERDLRRRSGDDLMPRDVLDSATETAPWWVRLVLRLVPSFLFRAKLRGVVPGSEYRWLLRQPYLAPHDPGTFIGFAERLTSGLLPGRSAEPREDTGQLAKLLVNAFLEDVRRAYRRSLWRIRSARRTVYPVVLLDGIRRDNGGYAVLKLINDVRNDTGAFDPLVIISGSEKVPPDAENAAEREPVAVGQASHAYETWARKLATDSRARRPTAWFLPLRVPPVPIVPGEVPPTATLSVRPAPVWSRTSVLAVLVVLLLTAVGAVGYRQVSGIVAENDGWRYRHCGLERDNPDAHTLERLGDDCVGVTTGLLPLFGTGDPADLARFDKAQQRLVDQNRKVLEAHERDPERPYATVVYVSAMSTARDALASNTARLMGVAARQAQLLERTGPDEPLVRVLFGNAGANMQHGEVVARTLGSMLERDKSIVGVLGMALSRRTTRETITKLGEVGLPVVAATLSDDHMRTASRMYFQVSPNNDRQARVVARYVRSAYPDKRGVVVVHSNDEEDSYASNLREDLVLRFTEQGDRVREEPYRPATGNEGSDARRLGQQLCGVAEDEVVFFAGRPADFGKLMDGVSAGCKDRPPVLLAGDDIARYAADRTLRNQHPEIPYDYVSFAIGSPGCVAATAMHQTLRAVFEEECAGDANPSLDGHAALTYDALYLFVHAMTKLGPIPVSPGHVWKEIGDIRGDQALSGESGVLDFEDGQVPTEKFIAVLRVADGAPPLVIASCGRYSERRDVDVRRAGWCPDGGR